MKRLLWLLPVALSAQVHRAEQSLEIRYQLLPPETHQFRISHDFSVDRPGQKYVHSFVRKGSVVSPDSRIICLDTGKVLKTYTVTGKEVNALGYYPNPTDPDSVVVQAELEKPVGEGLSTRVRVEETYTDPVGYTVKDGDLVWERTLGRPFNQVTLPDGWMLKSVNTPATISMDSAGRVSLRFINIRTDQLSVSIHATKRPAVHLANLKQLTHGGQNAEAYWSPDGKRLVFQSTRDGHECDQIYIMDAADGGNAHMVSTGKGVTTCGYFLADSKHIVYASTHEAGEACPPRADRSKGYVWAVYPGFDIYLATDAGKIEKKLTDAPGYDAEATVNWKQNKIVYTSLASGDLDLWTMNADGSGKKRFTTSEGYDGGAVLSRDGSKIVWRAHHPATPEDRARDRGLLQDNLTSPMKMELFVADASDPAGAKQITSFGCAAFAPTFSPDGKKILFSSNKHKCDSSDFELYLINTDGTGLEQVTRFGGFTSFPEFSPDGKQIVFASSYQGTGRYEFNIFTADWRD